MCFTSKICSHDASGYVNLSEGSRKADRAYRLSHVGVSCFESQRSLIQLTARSEQHSTLQNLRWGISGLFTASCIYTITSFIVTSSIK